MPLIEEYVFRVSFLGFMVGDKPTKKWWPYIVVIIVFAFMHSIPYDVATLFQTFSFLYIATIVTLLYKFSNCNYLSVSIVHIFTNIIGVFIYPLFLGYDFSNLF